MTAYEQDPDVVWWGLQLFDGDPFSNCDYSDSVTQNNTDYYSEQNFKQEFSDMGCSNVENGKPIIHALQEELSQLSVAEASECLHEGVEHLQTSFYAQDWFSQPVGSYAFSNTMSEGGLEETNDVGPCSSCSSSTGNMYCEEEWSYPLELMDEFSLDGEVGKRLNQMVPIPHVPKINGEIPSINEATLDHQRLLDRLQMYQLVEYKVQGDGNCQFRSLSDQFYRTPEHHKFVRQQIVNQLKSYPEIYAAYVPMAYNDYLEKMSTNGEWGDHVTLQATADSYGVKIFVITSFKDTCYIEILPSVQKSNRVIFLSFWAEVHYNSIYPERDLPEVEIKKKGRHWVFQNNHLKSADDYITD